MSLWQIFQTNNWFINSDAFLCIGPRENLLCHLSIERWIYEHRLHTNNRERKIESKQEHVKPLNLISQFTIRYFGIGCMTIGETMKFVCHLPYIGCTFHLFIIVRNRSNQPAVVFIVHVMCLFKYSNNENMVGMVYSQYSKTDRKLWFNKRLVSFLLQIVLCAQTLVATSILISWINRYRLLLLCAEQHLDTFNCYAIIMLIEKMYFVCIKDSIFGGWTIAKYICTNWFA